MKCNQKTTQPDLRQKGEWEFGVKQRITPQILRNKVEGDKEVAQLSAQSIQNDVWKIEKEEKKDDGPKRPMFYRTEKRLDDKNEVKAPALQQKELQISTKDPKIDGWRSSV